MKYILAIIALCLIGISIFSCTSQIQIPNQDKMESKSTNKIDQLLKQLNNSNGSDVLVISHRGDWRNFPENSLEAFSSAIDMGVDMAEMDVAKTKDNQLVILHDKTLDRTTNGKGLVSDWTLDSLRKLYLKDGLGIETKYKIPTLEEALMVCKGNTLVNLDKSYEFFNQAYDVAKKTGTTQQIVMKGYNKTVDQVMVDFGTKLDTIMEKPVKLTTLFQCKLTTSIGAN
jgi:glycerophosphoryl diester phosphodiesterase